MSRKNLLKFSFDIIFERIRTSTDIENTVQLAEIIGIAQPTVSNNKRRGTFPVEWAYIIGKKYNLLTEWIMEGEGPKRLNQKELEGTKFSFLGKIACWIDEEKKREPKFSDWFEVEFGKKFPEFTDWKRKVESERESSLAQEQKIA